MRFLRRNVPSDQSEADSVSTYEFDMDVVRNSHSSRNRRRGQKRSRPANIGSFAPEGPVQSSDLQFAASLVSDSSEDLDDDRSVSDELDRSERSNVSTFSRLFGGDSTSSTVFSDLLPSRTISLSIVIGLAGFIASTLFLGFGIDGAFNDQEQRFQIRAAELVKSVELSWERYITGSQWVHQASALHPISRVDFLHIYEYLTTELDVQAMEWIPRVEHLNRSGIETESRSYFDANYPDLEYIGITGVELDDPGNPNTTISIQSRSVQEFYYPIHYIEPMFAENIPLIEFDLYSTDMNRQIMQLALDTWEPTATAPYNRPTPNGTLTEDQFIQVFHPGIPLSNVPNQQTQDIASLVIRVKTFVEIISQALPNDMSFYIYDSTEADEEPLFVLGAEIYVNAEEDSGQRIVYQDELSYTEVIEETFKLMRVSTVSVTSSREWTMVIIAIEDTFKPNIIYVILAGIFILVASLCISLWMATSFRRTKTVLEVKRKAELEKTALVVRSARENAKAEQELNDYIAHEVRNPLSAAMSACTFVKTAVNERNPMSSKESIQAIREDVDIIDNSLTFTHDLLRNMLDMHRAVSKELVIDERPLDVMHDLLDPVMAMLYNRGAQFEILKDCPDNLIISSDRLRLKQILLNLCRNATRFVLKGYVKLGAEVVDGNVRLYVEDSGYGISPARKRNLFAKFQESLEIMDQGSGVGLCVCKSLADLLGSKIMLDEDFDSGIEGYPGTRFIIDVNKKPLTNTVLKEEGGIYPPDDTQTAVSTIAEEPFNLSESFRTEFYPAENTTAGTDPVEETNPEKEEIPPRLMMPVDETRSDTHTIEPDETTWSEELEEVPMLETLPNKLSVLFVDDDMILRKLFVRSVKKVVSTWIVKEAASGEAALKMCENHDFDLIFMDQYMSSVEKQLLGTETTRILRSKGVGSRICGLSANDVEQIFYHAGADSFLIKPLPCKKPELEAELKRLLAAPRHGEGFEELELSDPKDSSESLRTNTTAAEEKSEELLPLKG